MYLSDLSVTRPVFAAVLSLLLIAFGLMAFDRIPLREYPDIDAPVVSIETSYRGASASVVETRITQVIEDRIAGLAGINFIQSSSQDGRSSIVIEFANSRRIDDAANDVRDRVGAILDELPDDADPPEISKVDANDDVILWLNLVDERLSVPELTDYARRHLVDRFSVLDGVARVRIGGEQEFAMRIWLNRDAMTAHNITVTDVEAALRAENVDLPAGNLESGTRQFSLRTMRSFRSAEEFAGLVIRRGQDDGYLVRLGDIATVTKGSLEDRTLFRGNGQTMIGLGIIRQSTANTLDVARAALAEARRINNTLPEGMFIAESYDTSVFIERAITEVFSTLGIAIILVIVVIFLFLGSARATLVPAVTVPVSIIATFIVLYALGYSANLFTLLALVLAIGLVVDDGIIVLENIHRRLDTLGETPLVAAYRGTRQVNFAVIVTTLVLLAVFIPIALIEGNIGYLFREFAVTMAAAVAFSSLVALTMVPMLSAKLLKHRDQTSATPAFVNRVMARGQTLYRRGLRWSLNHRFTMVALFVFMLGAMAWLFTLVPKEFVPREDRGAFFVMVSAPEGSSYSYTKTYMDEIERRLLRYVENGEAARLIVRAPRAFGATTSFNSGIVIVVLKDWQERRYGFVIMDEIRRALADLPGVRAFPVMRQGLGNGPQKPVQFVIGGGTYEELAAWRDVLLEKIDENPIGLDGIDWNYKETQPQLRIAIDYNRAADLGVRLDTIGNTLQTMLGSRRVTTFIDQGEEYDVVLEGNRQQNRTPATIENIYVRSERTQALIPLSNLVRIEEVADSSSLNRFNRMRAITIEANLSESLALGDALTHLENLARTHLPSQAVIDYKAQSREFKNASASLLFVFILGLVVVYLVLAAQFESYIHPLVIMLTVPMALSGGLLGLWLFGQNLNVYSQIGLIVLVGIATKNGILIVEFINQLRDEGFEFMAAIEEASRMRLRPILMTSITTAAGAVPLLLSSGAGAETRFAIGTVILWGVLIATVFTLFIVPTAYRLLARHTASPLDGRRQLQSEIRQLSKHSTL